MDNQIDDERFKAYVVDRIVPFPKMLYYAGYEDYSYDGKYFCTNYNKYGGG